MKLKREIKKLKRAIKKLREEVDKLGGGAQARSVSLRRNTKMRKRISIRKLDAERIKNANDVKRR